MVYKTVYFDPTSVVYCSSLFGLREALHFQIVFPLQDFAEGYIILDLYTTFATTKKVFLITLYKIHKCYLCFWKCF